MRRRQREWKNQLGNVSVVLYKSQILFLICYRKAANFLGVPVRISQNHKILHNNSKLFLKHSPKSSKRFFKIFPDLNQSILCYIFKEEIKFFCSLAKILNLQKCSSLQVGNLQIAFQQVTKKNGSTICKSTKFRKTNKII